MKENIKYIEKGIQSKENRYIIRVMRTLFSTRKRLNDPVLKRLINYYYITSSVQSDKEFLLTFIDTTVTSSQTTSTSNVAVRLIIHYLIFTIYCIVTLF